MNWNFQCCLIKFLITFLYFVFDRKLVLKFEMHYAFQWKIFKLKSIKFNHIVEITSLNGRHFFDQSPCGELMGRINREKWALEIIYNFQQVQRCRRAMRHLIMQTKSRWNEWEIFKLLLLTYQIVFDYKEIFHFLVLLNISNKKCLVSHLINLMANWPFDIKLAKNASSH